MILAVALMLRSICAVLFSGEIDTEGAEYARIAENIRSGRGYSGIATEGVQLFFPPLFPLLIAGISMLTGDAETAGRIINILLGTLLALPVYGIARRMLGEALGLVAASIVAVHPYLVSLSTTVFCESTFLTLVLAAVFFAMLAADQPDRKTLASAGILYGLAYLVRPEAAIFMVVGATFFLLQRTQINCRSLAATAGREIQRAGAMVICFAVVAAPYILWLSQQTGGLRLQTKSILNVATELRIQQGLPDYAASFAVSPELVAEGPFVRPNIDVIRENSPSFADYLKILAKKSQRLLTDTAVAIGGSPEFGSPALFALAVLGIFGRPWRAGILIGQLHVLALLSLSVVAQFFIYYSSPRFYVLLLVVFCIWASAGLLRVAEWARLTISSAEQSVRAQKLASRIAIALAVGALMAPAALLATKNMLWTRGSRPIRALAIDLATGSSGLKIADTSTPFSFHARAEFVWLPYCNEETASRYLIEKRVTHVVLRDIHLNEVPYLRSWVQNGVPGARLVAWGSRHDGREFVRIFRLQQTPGAP